MKSGYKEGFRVRVDKYGCCKINEFNKPSFVIENKESKEVCSNEKEECSNEKEECSKEKDCSNEKDDIKKSVLTRKKTLRKKSPK